MLRRPEAIEFSRIGAAIEAAVRTLPDNAHAALLLTAVDDLTEAQAAEILGISVQTLMARVTAARHRIARELAVIGGMEPDAPLTHALIEAVVHRLANPPQPIPSRESLLVRLRRGARMLRHTWTNIIPGPAIQVAAGVAGVVLLLVILPRLISPDPGQPPTGPVTLAQLVAPPEANRRTTDVPIRAFGESDDSPNGWRQLSLAEAEAVIRNAHAFEQLESNRRRVTSTLVRNWYGSLRLVGEARDLLVSSTVTTDGHRFRVQMPRGTTPIDTHSSVHKTTTWLLGARTRGVLWTRQAQTIPGTSTLVTHVYGRVRGADEIHPDTCESYYASTSPVILYAHGLENFLNGQEQGACVWGRNG